MEKYAYPVRQFAGATKRVVQTLDLKDDPELVAAYKHWHSREGIWPEILQGIKDSGLDMEKEDRNRRFTSSVPVFS